MTAPTLTRCVEPWCTDHVVDEYDGVTLHASRDVRVPVTAGGPREQTAALVAIERTDPENGSGAGHVRLELEGPVALLAGAPMTPWEALQLSEALAIAARTLLGVTR
jgi:hypothetical protein